MVEILPELARIPFVGWAMVAGLGLLGMVLLRHWKLLLLGLVVLSCFSLWSCVLVNQEQIIFPGAYFPKTASTGPRDPRIEQIWLTADDGCRIEAWYEVGRGRSAASPGPAAIYFHGNCDTVDTAAWILPHYAQLGISILIVEYRGYGRCDGEPSEKAIVADSVKFFDWLADRPEVDRTKIILHGQSLGGGVAVGVAGQRKPAAMILEATFKSIASMAKRYLMPESFCRHPFRSDRIIATLDIPIAIFHGRYDATIPISHGRKLHELAPNSRFTELPCGHNHYHNDFANIVSFVREVGLVPEK